MDFNLKDLGATLVTGAYFLLGVVFLLHVIFGWNFLVFLRLAKRVSSVALTILTLSLAFGAGMLLEDLSNKFVDSGAAKIPILGLRLLPFDEDLRTETLFGKKFVAALPTEKDLKEAASSGQTSVAAKAAMKGELEPARLCRSAAALNLLKKHGPEGVASQQAVVSKEPKVTRKDAGEAAQRLYYEAKNTVYAVNNHYDELKQIQTRIDFSRSFSLLSLALVAVCIICAGIALAVPDLGVRIAQRFHDHPNQTSLVLSRGAVVLRVLLVILVLVSIFFLGQFAYRSEEIEFDKRAYGYFLTLAARSERTPTATTEFSQARKEATAKTNTHATLSASPIGYSGLARIDQSTFLVAHDIKAESGEARLGTLHVQPGSTPLYVPLKVDWGAEPPPNDFEAVCDVPGQEREFLATESGYEGGKFGRVFHIVLTKGVEQWDVTVKGRIFLPKDTENIEGLTCVRNAAGELILLLGERGGSNQNPTGKIRWAALDLIAYRMQILGEKNLIVPSQIAGQKGVRACADLYLDDRKQLWSVATQDRSDDGPFRSVIYQAGTIDPSAPEPFHLLPQINAAWILDGVKVEGIAASPIENSPISIATDDENYEGIWRPLFPAR